MAEDWGAEWGDDGAFDGGANDDFNEDGLFELDAGSSAWDDGDSDADTPERASASYHLKEVLWNSKPQLSDFAQALVEALYQFGALFQGASKAYVYSRFLRHTRDEEDDGIPSPWGRGQWAAITTALDEMFHEGNLTDRARAAGPHCIATQAKALAAGEEAEERERAAVEAEGKEAIAANKTTQHNARKHKRRRNKGAAPAGGASDNGEGGGCSSGGCGGGGGAETKTRKVKKDAGGATCNRDTTGKGGLINFLKKSPEVSSSLDMRAMGGKSNSGGCSGGGDGGGGGDGSLGVDGHLDSPLSSDTDGKENSTVNGLRSSLDTLEVSPVGTVVAGGPL